MVSPGSRTDRVLTRETTKAPSWCSDSAAPAGPPLRTASEAAASSPRAANRAASRAESMHCSCIPTAASPPTHNTRTTASAATAKAASTVTPPDSPRIPRVAALSPASGGTPSTELRRWCSTPG
jgi:hypothetical protein